MKISGSHPLVYSITDRRKIPISGNQTETETLARYIEDCFACGINLVQIREPDLSVRELFVLTQRAALSASRLEACVLINDRPDIAAACPGAGVHLTTRSLPPKIVRALFPEMLIGASTHSVEQVASAAAEGADFVVFGPVFETESKRMYGPPQGLEQLSISTAMSPIPVLALGGVNRQNFTEPLKRGAAGIAAISLFADAWAAGIDSLKQTVKTIITRD